MLRDNLELNSGLVKFGSKESVIAYLETLLEYYKTRQEEYGHQLGEQLRNPQGQAPPREKPEKESKKDKGGQGAPRGWVKVGSLPVNSSDPQGALAQVTLRIVDDYKSRVERLSDALKSFLEVDTLSQNGTRSYTLFIFKGVPEGVIVEGMVKREVFAFAARFRTL
ncbi:MAG: hypothetical protein JRM74_05230 [Nitrososphaerota archaeon]|nr:hypothetical protein [Nitrososphaerota archaeon]